MFAFEDDEGEVFESVSKSIGNNAKKLIHSLNINWKILGVDEVTRRSRTESLIKIVQERYDEVLEETMEKIKIISLHIENLKKEASQLSEALSINIDVDHPENLSLNLVKENLEKDLLRFRRILEARKEHITRLNDVQERLHEFMGVVPKDIPESPLPSDKQLDELAQYLRRQEEEYEKRVLIFQTKQHDIRNILRELEETPQDSFQHYIVNSSPEEFRVTETNMTKMDSVYEGLCNRLEERKTEILEMRERLALLWERLEESPLYRDAFLVQNPGHSRTTESAILEELKRCEEKKRQSFKLFVIKVRSEIVEMWNKCLYSDLQREKFSEYYSNIFNEDLLMLHEIYLEELKEYQKENKDIFDMYALRQKLWVKWRELEARANEPGRFHNRGGQLLQEEKERKAVSNQLPKIEAELTQLVELFESRSGKTFMVNGESLLQTMQDDWNQKNAERQIKLSARKLLSGPVNGAMSAPRSAPSTRQLPLLSVRGTLTAVKRRLSPRQSPQVSKSRILPRRLQMTPGPAGSNEPTQSTEAKRFKGVIPSVAVNGYIVKKKKVVGRRSQESKHKRRSRRSKSSSSAQSKAEEDQRMPDSSLTSYADFQEHLNEKKTSRSSVVPGRTLRSQNFQSEVSSTVFMPNGQNTPLKSQFSANIRTPRRDENMSPYTPLSKVTPKSQLYASNTFGTTPIGNRIKQDGKAKRNEDTFATPRPVGKSGLYRQNTISLASPSLVSRPMLRSSSSHNLRSMSPSHPLQSPKLHLASKLPLII